MKGNPRFFFLFHLDPITSEHCLEGERDEGMLFYRGARKQELLSYSRGSAHDLLVRTLGVGFGFVTSPASSRIKVNFPAKMADTEFEEFRQIIEKLPSHLKASTAPFYS